MPSKKVLKAKEQIVAGLTEEFKSAQTIVFADYRGLTVAQDTEMRAGLRKGNVTYQVVKNTMSERALKEAGYAGLEDILVGPTAIAYSDSDPVSPAKLVKEFAGKFDNLEIKGGILEGKVVTVDAINRLAAIPTVEVLYGQLVFSLISPVTKLAILLNAAKEKMEEAGLEKAGDLVAAAVTEETAESSN